MHSHTGCSQDAAPELELFVVVCRQHNAQSGYVLANQQYILALNIHVNIHVYTYVCMCNIHWQYVHIRVMLLASTSVIYACISGMILCVLFRELLRRGTEVVLVGNTLPAINDITVSELVSVLEDVAHFCPVIKASSLFLGQLATLLSLGQLASSLFLGHLACSSVRASRHYIVIPPKMVNSV